MLLKLAGNKTKDFFLSKSGIRNRMHLIIPNAMSHRSYGNLSAGGHQLIRSEKHKFKDDCNEANREQM